MYLFINYFNIYKIKVVISNIECCIKILKIVDTIEINLCIKLVEFYNKKNNKLFNYIKILN